MTTTTSYSVPVTTRKFAGELKPGDVYAGVVGDVDVLYFTVDHVEKIDGLRVMIESRYQLGVIEQTSVRNLHHYDMVTTFREGPDA